MQIDSPVVVDVAVAAGSFGGQERHPKDVIDRAGRSGYDAQGKIGRPLSNFEHPRSAKPDHEGRVSPPARPLAIRQLSIQIQQARNLTSYARLPGRGRPPTCCFVEEDEQFAQITFTPARSKILAAFCLA